MPLELHPLAELDMPDFVRISLAAFEGNMLSKLKARPITPETIQKSIDKHLKSFRTEPDVHYLKIIDTDLDEGQQMIAGAKWRINEKERSEEDASRMYPVPGPDEEGNAFARVFMEYLAGVRREFMGTKPFYFLHMLVADPAHQKRGAGAMLVRWGTARADKVGLPALLEGSEAGKSLYEKMGYRVRREEVFDLTTYGGQGEERSFVMVRDAVGAE